MNPIQGRIQDFKLGGAHLKKLRRAEGGAKIFGVFRVKNHDFTPKNHIFSIAEGGAKILEVFRVKNHDFTPKNHIFESAPAIYILYNRLHAKLNHCYYLLSL